MSADAPSRESFERWLARIPEHEWVGEPKDCNVCPIGVFLSALGHTAVSVWPRYYYVDHLPSFRVEPWMSDVIGAVDDMQRNITAGRLRRRLKRKLGWRIV